MSVKKRFEGFVARSGDARGAHRSCPTIQKSRKKNC